MDLVALESFQIKDFMSIQSIISIRSKRGEDISPWAFCLGSSCLLKSHLFFPPSFTPSLPLLLLRCCRRSATRKAWIPGTSCLPPSDHDRPRPPWDVAQDLPLAWAGSWSRYHLWLLLLPLVFHHNGAGEKEAIRFPPRQALQSHRDEINVWFNASYQTIFQLHSPE